MWVIANTLGSISILVLVLYIIGAPIAHPTSFLKNSHSSSLPYFDEGLLGFIKTLPEISWTYFGFEMIPLLSSDMIEV